MLLMDNIMACSPPLLLIPFLLSSSTTYLIFPSHPFFAFTLPACTAAGRVPGKAQGRDGGGVCALSLPNS